MVDAYVIEDIVDVRVNLADRPISQAGFETPLILASHSVFTDRFRVYTDTDAILADGFASNSNVMKLATKIFSGNNPPASILVGRRALTDYRLTFDVADDTDYTISVKANAFTKTFTVTSDANATAAEIVDAFVTDLEADADIGGLIAASNISVGGSTLIVAPEVGVELSIGATTSNVTISSTSSETVDDALLAVVNESDDWFFLLSDSHSETDVLALAAYAEANKKLYSHSTQESDVITSATTDIVSQLQTLQYDNTISFVHQTADKDFPEGGIVGAMAGLVPGSSTLHGKTLPGVSTTTFTRTQSEFATGKNGNVYPLIASVGFFLDGKMASGRFFDVIRGKLYLEARMEEAIFAEIKRKSDLGQKIPFTDAGITIIEAIMYDQLARRVQEGFLASSPAPKVFPPLAADVDSNDKANRLLPDIPFEATLAGAIHRVIVRGYVTI